MSVKKYSPKREGNECVVKSAMFNGSNQPMPGTEKTVCHQGKLKSVNGQGYTVKPRSSDNKCCIYTAKLVTANGGQVVKSIDLIVTEGNWV